MALGPALARFEIAPPLVGFYTFLLGALAGIIALVWGVISFIRKRTPRSLLISALGVPAVLIIGIATVRGTGHPRINDVATDLDDPPALSVAADYPDDFKDTVAAHYYDIHTLEVKESPADAFAAALAAAESRGGWSLSATDRDNLTFEGYEKSAIFRFRDDFVVRVRAKGAGTAIDMRSRSRNGRGDLGVNAKRIRSFLNTLREKLTPSPSEH
jgi:uncharacterized protein (DUF1499 family)